MWVNEMKQVIHINQHHIRHNQKCDISERKPVITCKTYKENQYRDSVDLVCVETGEVFATIMYSPDKPLSCGARVWVEVNTDIVQLETHVEGT